MKEDLKEFSAFLRMVLIRKGMAISVLCEKIGQYASQWVAGVCLPDELDQVRLAIFLEEPKLAEMVNAIREKRELAVPAGKPKMLRDFRVLSGYTKAEFSRKTGVSRQTISNWETGKVYPTRKQWHKLSEAYGFQPDQKAWFLQEMAAG